MIVNNIKTELFYFHSLTQSVHEIRNIFILNIFYVYDPIELKFSMIVNNIKTQLFVSVFSANYYKKYILNNKNVDKCLKNTF